MCIVFKLLTEMPHSPLKMSMHVKFEIKFRVGATPDKVIYFCSKSL